MVMVIVKSLVPGDILLSCTHDIASIVILYRVNLVRSHLLRNSVIENLVTYIDCNLHRVFTSRAAARSWVIVRWACCSWEDHCPLNWVLLSKSPKK